MDESTNFLRLLDTPFSSEDCHAWVEQLQSRGPHATAGAYPSEYRNNDRLVLDDPGLAEVWRAALVSHLPARLIHEGQVWTLEGINPRFRACRYQDGQAFARHRDGPWRRADGARSLLTAMLYLSPPESYAGGETAFFDGPASPAPRQCFRPPRGSLLLFSHQAWHEGRPVTWGTKWVLRTDILYRPPATGAAREDRGYLWDLVEHDGALAIAGRDGRILRGGEVYQGPGGSLLCLASHQGRLYAGDRQGCLHAWSQPGPPQASWRAHPGAVLRLRTSPEGLWSAGADGHLRLWGPAGRLRELRGEGWQYDLLPGPAGPRRLRPGERALALAHGVMAVGRLDGVVEWKGKTWSAHQGPVLSLASCPDGLLSSGEDGRVLLLDDRGPRELHRHHDVATRVLHWEGAAWSVGYDGRLLRTALPQRR